MAFVSIILVYTAATLTVVNSWRDEETLWRTTVQAHPRSPIAQLKPGQAVVIRWHQSESFPSAEELVQADRCFITALTLNPTLAHALVGRGIVAERRGDRAAAERFLHQATALASDDPGVAQALRTFLKGAGSESPR